MSDFLLYRLIGVMLVFMLMIVLFATGNHIKAISRVNSACNIGTFIECISFLGILTLVVYAGWVCLISIE